MLLKNASQLILTKLGIWQEQTINFLPNIVTAIFISTIFLFISKGLRKYIYSSIDKFTKKKSLKNFATTLIQALIIGLGLLMSLSILNLGKAVTSLLAGAGAAGLIIGFAVQEIISNLFSGITISISEPFNIGDLVEIDGKLGKVKQIKSRTTVIQTPGGQMLEIPNKEVINNTIINYTTAGKRRIEIKSGISYNDNKEKAKQIALKVVKEIEDVDKKEPIEFYYERFGDSALNFVLRFWMGFENSQKNYFQLRSEVITKLLMAYDDNDITMPYPISTVKIEKESG